MKKIVLAAIILSVFQSCITKKGTIYMQNESYPASIKTSFPFEPIIKSDNILNIVVSGDNPQAASVFNIVAMNKNLNSDKNFLTPTNVTYLVDNNGEIEMPVIGKIKVEGLKKSELISILKKKISPFVENPVLYISILNYRVYVTGEVNRPGEQKLENGERVTLLEALSKAGDLTINGNRKKVKVIRENNGLTTINTLDLTKPEFINSDFYFLQQNDVVYIEPNRAKIGINSITPLATIMSIVATGISLYVLTSRL